jgi:hypothetical protein
LTGCGEDVIGQETGQTKGTEAHAAADQELAT